MKPVVVLGAGPAGISAAWRLAERGVPVVVLENRTPHRVTSVKLRFKAEPGSHGVTAYRTDIGPGGRSVYRSSSLIQGNASRMRVQVIGVGFDDGSLWGELDGEIDARDETIDVPQTIRYPAAARRRTAD